MPALFFPNPDALRLVIASGFLPLGITDTPARVSFDEHGGLRLDPSTFPTRELLSGLGRFGVRIGVDASIDYTTVGSWAEALPLRPAFNSLASPPDSVLFQVSVTAAAAFLARIRRSDDGSIGVAFPREDRVWITVERPSQGLLLRIEERPPGIESFVEQSRNIWVEIGWYHPLPSRVVVGTDQSLLLHSKALAELFDRRPPIPHTDDFTIGPRRVPPTPFARVEPVRVPFRLTPSPATKRETLWVYSDEEADAFWDYCRSADERALRRIEVAILEQAGLRRLVVRGVPGAKAPPLLGPPARGFVADDRVTQIFFPQGRTLSPEVRSNELIRRFGVSATRVTWIEPGPGNAVHPHHVLASSFYRLSELVAYASDRLISCVPHTTNVDAFPLHRFALQDEPEVESLLEATADFSTSDSPSAAEAASRTGWLGRSLERLAERFRRPREKPPEKPEHEATTQAKKGRRQKSFGPVDKKLDSADVLLHGHQRTSRREALEAGLLADFPALTPEQRAARWSDLAAVYSSTGNPSDASVCWMNAVWEVDVPPLAWAEQWQLAECRVARLNGGSVTFDRLLSEPGRFGMGRVLAASVVLAVRRNLIAPAWMKDLPAILAFLDHHFDDLPARAAWLARHSLARLSQGDTLGLARWRDRILDRLRERGPGLDLDEPSFLRFHETTSPDRFRMAREWLTKSRGNILGWVAKLGTPGRLQWAGLDAEIDCTGAYGQLLLAWGLGHLGERTRSRDWTARARKVLTRAGGLGVDPGVHTFLADLFSARIRDAQEGRVAKVGIPSDLQARYEHLSDFSRYAVDKLRRFVHILEPIDRVHDYRGREYRPFWGDDQLGERLTILTGRNSPAYQCDEARQLLATCAATPTSDQLPRITFAILECASNLDGGLVYQALGQVVPALEWLEAWVHAGRWTPAELRAALMRYQVRFLESTFSAATRWNQIHQLRPIVEYLARAAAGDSLLRHSLEAVSTTAFRSLRKLGFGAESELLLNLLDPSRGQGFPDARFPSSRLGLAVGWFAVGDEDAGNRILNDARDRLFLNGDSDDRECTELAIAYANALGFAPPRIALGRLEELFQRLERVTLTGSTNRYFTLKPLELIDAVVRAVVTEDFALGPAVRGWMDDDEFLIRQRIHRDMADVVRADEAGWH
jgi:hypothetical protein